MIIGSDKYPKNDYSNVVQYVLQLRLNLYLYMLCLLLIIYLHIYLDMHN